MVIKPGWADEISMNNSLLEILAEELDEHLKEMVVIYVARLVINLYRPNTTGNTDVKFRVSIGLNNATMYAVCFMYVDGEHCCYREAHELVDPKSIEKIIDLVKRHFSHEIDKLLYYRIGVDLNEPARV